MRTKDKNWAVKIVEDVGSLAGSEFIWGKTDCASLLRKTSVSMYGEDIFKGLVKSKYTTKAGALRCYKASGRFDDIIKQAGGVEIPSSVARDGDVAVEQDDGRGFQNLSVRIGSKWIVASSENGMIEAHRTMPDGDVKVYRI